MSTEEISPGVSQFHLFDPFLEPRTIPSGWDLSELYPGPRPAFMVDDEHATNNQSDNPGMPIPQSLGDK